MEKKSAQAIFYHLIIIDYYLSLVHLFQMAQIFSVFAKQHTISKANNHFEHVFSQRNQSYLFMYEDRDHVIDLVNTKYLS